MSVANMACDVFYTQAENLQVRPLLTSQTPLDEPITSVGDFCRAFGEGGSARGVEKSTLKFAPTRSSLRRNWLVHKKGPPPTQQQVADVVLDFVVGHHIE